MDDQKRDSGNLIASVTRQFCKQVEDNAEQARADELESEPRQHPPGSICKYDIGSISTI